MASNKHAIVVGANGLVGTELTKLLLNDSNFSKVTLMSRRYLDIEHEKLDMQIIDFRELHKVWDLFSCDELFYCLGTTKADTPKAADYLKVEYDYAVNIAKISNHNKVSQFHYISSSGANPKSWFSYLKIKGDVEQELMKIKFESLHIYRPYVLMGKRGQFRFVEAFARLFLGMFDFMMIGFLKNIKGMPATLLAKSMVYNSLKNKKGISIHSNKDIHNELSKK